MANSKTLDERYFGTYVSSKSDARDAPDSIYSTYALAPNLGNSAYGTLSSYDSDVYGLASLSPGKYTIYAASITWDESSTNEFSPPIIKVKNSSGNNITTVDDDVYVELFYNYAVAASSSFSVSATSKYYVQLSTTDGPSQYQLFYTFSGITVPPANSAPTLSSFGTSVKSSNEDAEAYISLIDLKAAGNEEDADGSVSAFVVTAVSSGTLKIGMSPGAATAWNASTNNTIDAINSAYWTPAANANGTLNAFTAVAQDNSGATSGINVQASVVVNSINDAPTLTAFTTAVKTTTKNTAASISLSDLKAAGNEEDADGSVSAFVVKAVSSGTLKIGSTSSTAAVWSTTNNTIDATNLAFWTPNANVTGSLNAFTVVAKDNGGLESSTSIQAAVSVSYSGEMFTGDLNANTLTGGLGSDTITGAGGVDVLDGKENSDLYLMADGDHQSSEVKDSGSSGVDEVRFTAVTTAKLTLFAGDTGIEKVVIGTGSATTADTSGTTALDLDASAVLNGLTILGNAGANSLIGTRYADSIDGGGGNDTLNGGEVADTLIGGLGNDTYLVALTANGGLEDTVIEASTISTEIDTIKVSGSSTNIFAVAVNLNPNVENLDISGTNTSLLNLTGNTLSNILIGNAAANILLGGFGNDTLDGGIGSVNDTIDGGQGIDTVSFATLLASSSLSLGVTLNLADSKDTIGYVTASGLGGADKIKNVENILGSSYADSLTGDSEANSLNGGNGIDNLNGGVGDDTLNGGLGNDRLTGGDGKDVFVFNTVTANNVDKILDFVSGTDKIQLSKAVFADIGATGSLTANLFSSGTTAQEADDRISYNSTTGALYYDADGNGAGAAVQIAILGTTTPHPTIAYTDFAVIA